jgi:hypothetical protein
MTRNEVGPSRWQHVGPVHFFLRLMGPVHGPARNLYLVNGLGQVGHDNMGLRNTRVLHQSQDANKTMGQTVPQTTNKAE